MSNQDDIEELAKEIGRQCGRIANGLYWLTLVLAMILGVLFGK